MLPHNAGGVDVLDGESLRRESENQCAVWAFLAVKPYTQVDRAGPS